MTYSGRVTIVGLLGFWVLVLASNSWAQQRPPILEPIVKTYGLDSFGQIEGIRYAVSLDFPGVKLSHTWEWEPQTGRVFYEGKDKDSSRSKFPISAASAAANPTP